MADYATCAHLQGATPVMMESVVRSVAGQSLAIGERDVWSALATLREIVERMGTLEGQRSLILISPGFLTLTPGAISSGCFAFALIPVLRFYAFPIVVELLVLNRAALSSAAAPIRRSAVPQHASAIAEGEFRSPAGPDEKFTDGLLR